jgi:hypothetical protein
VTSSFTSIPKEEFPEDYNEIKNGDPEVVEAVVEIWRKAYIEGHEPNDDTD